MNISIMFGINRGALQTTKTITIAIEALVYLKSLFLNSDSLYPVLRMVHECIKCCDPILGSLVGNEDRLPLPNRLQKRQFSKLPFDELFATAGGCDMDLRMKLWLAGGGRWLGTEAEAAVLAAAAAASS